ncbi:glycoside hydrolase family 30 protein [Myriangium duriaei CBS 260.36]|uniref:Glycoside hydrolase family 30 protein n=1 Tax=Myriangium duriaei CBS 260.36 TaxID=1168546 RepID=A0A9P4J906_9PEZI|nr:glycoside hydrolase family 30 protein [Myriangium duriaei CBS 260.36]
MTPFIISLICVLSSVAQASPLIQRRQSGAQAFASNRDLSLKLSPIDAPVRTSTQPSSDGHWVLNVDDTPSGYKQTVRGFGGSVTDATVTVINALRSDQRSQLLNELLTSAGANFAFLRHNIGASDLASPPAYTYDDSNGQADPQLNNFGLGDSGVALAKILAEMKRIKPSATILGSSWSAPGWMKQSGRLTGTTDGNSLVSDYYSAFADYFVKYLQAFGSYGATVDAITIQNEPLNNQGNGMITMLMQPDEAATVTNQYVGPALRKAGLNTAIWAYDHNTDRPDYPQKVMQEAGDYVEATAWHCYANPLDWSVITNFHNQFPNKANHMTECWTSPQTSWYQSSSSTVGPLQNWAETSAMWTLGTWTQQSDGSFGPYIPGGCNTCRGLFVVDKSSGTYQYTIDYYMLAQYSKFIPAGAKVLSGTGSYTYGDSTGIQSVATINPDGTKTVVIQSTLNSDVEIALECTSGAYWVGKVPQNTVVTWILPSS